MQSVIKMDKLQKIIANAGVTSRRKAEDMINEGRVFVNGKVAKIGDRASKADEISVDGDIISKAPKEYYLLYKPIGYITTTNDEKNRETVVDLVPSINRIYPVGRLDANTSGLLILTNDGELTNILIHPKHRVSKKYIAKVNGIVTMADVNTIKKGVFMDTHKVRPDSIKVKSKNPKNKTSIVEIVVHDGKNHEIKRFFKAIGLEVISLKRTEFAFLHLRGLSKGEYRKINPKEVKLLYNLGREK